MRWTLTLAEAADCNFLSSHPETRFFETRRPWTKHLFAKNLWRLVRRVGALLTTANQIGRWPTPRNSLCFFVVSKNNYDSVRPVQEEIDSSYFLASDHSLPWGRLVPGFPMGLIALAVAPFLLFHAWTTTGHARRALRGSFHEYAEVYGAYYTYLFFFALRKPKGVVFSNDHLPVARAALRACSRLGIPTLFIPHSLQDPSCLPPLEFDFAYLYGRESVAAYQRVGITSRAVYQVGIPKFDRYVLAANSSSSARSIGICTNLLTEESVIGPLTDRVTDLGFDEVILRPHPRDNRAHPIPAGTSTSDPNQEDAFSFLSRVDVIVAGDTGILLEAALVNVVPVYFSELGLGADMFGFVKNGLAIPAEGWSQLEKTLRGLQDRKVDVRDRAKPFVSFVGSPLEGTSSQLVVHLINANLRGQLSVKAVGGATIQPVLTS